MLPSSTVENYLKAIYQAQTGLARPDALVPMGQLASALGVVPGTATTMVKALAESGLVRYEPYAGVRLTKAGEKLAALVLRRHRLVELFLVKVMGMSWTEVHDEAEQLEHAVSDRLIDRIDEMLGRPRSRSPRRSDSRAPKGRSTLPSYETLLTCPLQRAGACQPRQRSGSRVPAVHRAPRSEAGRGRGGRPNATPRPTACRVKGAREFTIGARAASKVLVQAAAALLLVLSLAGRRSAAAAGAVAPQTAASRSRSRDNSFLVEEAFNQEAGIFQNIFNAVRSGRRLGGDVHPGMAGRLADAPVLVHAARGSRSTATRRSATRSSTTAIRRCWRDPGGPPSLRASA